MKDTNPDTIHKNFFLNLIAYIQEIIENPARYCLVCHEKHLGEMAKFRPCSSQICECIFKENLLFPLYKEITDNPEIVNLEMSFAIEAIVSSRYCEVFNPYPRSLLDEFPIDDISNPPYLLPQRVPYLPDMNLLKQLILSIPKLDNLFENSTTEESIINYLATFGYGNVIYQLIKDILSANRLNLFKLTKNCLINGLNENIKQFIVKNNSEKEKQFMELKRAHGSIFAYYGSSVENWYSIMRNGLKKSVGNLIYEDAVYCEGILCTNNILRQLFSLHHCNIGSYNCSESRNPAKFCIGVVEIIKSDTNLQDGDIYLVTNEKNVIIRYLLIDSFDILYYALPSASNLSLEDHYNRNII